MSTSSRPTLLNSCARAATSAEVRYRIDGPEPARRATRVVALDPGAGALIEQAVTHHDWRGARFLTFEQALPMGEGEEEITVGAVVRGEATADAVLRDEHGAQTRLDAELRGADTVVMVAASDRGADGALMVGASCAARGIMTAGLAVQSRDGDKQAVDRTVSMLRPYAMVLLVSRDADDLVEVLSALRA